jgi:EAL domain-containing protein (putative c-di-GMP-specific phosphodiesterase class I)
MNVTELNSNTIATLLRDAIDSNSITQLYQPKVSASSGLIVGVEALARWNDPQLGYVSPAVFIPIAEQMGMIETLTLNVISRTIRQCSQWNDQGIHLNMAINISIQDLHNKDIVVHIADSLMYNSVDPSQITLEITETSIMEDHQKCAAVLGTLRAMGIGLSVDDFGTGHASFVYLKHFPITEIKIDKMFVDDVLTSQLDAKIVKFTTELAHDIGCKVVAEGVEDAKTAQVLQDIGCDVLQGYYFYKPMEAADISSLINSTQEVNA